MRVEICDATTNAIISTGPLSSAPIGLVLLDGDYDETNRSLIEFNRNILSQRYEKRPLLVGSDIKLNLESGVASIKSVSITDNSTWMKSKKFRFGAKIIDENILAMYPTIEAAVSQPFRVMDHRGEGKLVSLIVVCTVEWMILHFYMISVNKKHHPPSREDELWRLEGIRKDGIYHKNLSSYGIKNVDDFLLEYQKIGPERLRKVPQQNQNE